MVIDLKGKVMETGKVFVDTFKSNKKPLALVMESRPYSKGFMRPGGRRRVIVPAKLEFREKGVNLGSTVHIPPFVNGMQSA